MDLNQRKLSILKSIIDEYIDKGEPVGSKHLVEYGNISLSPATIRNEMSELEEMGYLDKPHTSAGRIPSNAAYRVYVEQLMESYRLNVEELELLNELTRYKTDELNKLMERAGKVFSEITHCASLSLMRSTGANCVSRYDVMPIDETSFLLAIILPDNSVKSKHIKTQTKLNHNDVQLVKEILNKRLCNVPIDSVSITEIMELEKEFGHLGALVNMLVKSIYSCVCDVGGNDVKIEGISNLLNYPEFKNIDRVKNLISMVEQKGTTFKNVLDMQNADSSSSNTELKIYIGDENTSNELSDTSMVFCSLPLGNGNDVVLGILGPKRMDYGKVISALKIFAENLQDNKKSPPGLPQG